MQLINKALNAITMYRLVLYGLIGLIVVSLVVSLFGRLSFGPLKLLISLGLVIGSAYVTNRVFAKVWDVPVNQETWLITALILLFVLQPVHDIASGIAWILAGALASASKFLIAPCGKHLLNPAAFAAAFVSLLGLLPSTWWIGSSVLWPFTLLLGLAVVLKIRRYALVLSFVGATLVLQAVQFILSNHPLADGLVSVVTASPLLFLSGIMLTEPATMPPRRTGQAVFGVIVGALFVLAPEIGPLIVYPEVALLVGNIYAFIVSPKRRYRLTLQRVERISSRVYNYVFTSDHKVQYVAGQYMEWTLAGVPNDGRGNRRSFTIASSPTEDTIQVGLKYYEPSSTFKDVFSRMRPGDTILAGQVSGSFTLAGVHGKKLAFIAGGVGVTPFRSMVKQIIDEKRQADVVVLYSVSSMEELAYADVFEEARAFGVRFVPVAPNPRNTQGIVNGPLTDTLLKDQIPDYAERSFFISGPIMMVQSTGRNLRKMGVNRSRIHTDYFSGY